MKLTLGISTSREINTDLFVKTSNDLEAFFDRKEYGIGVIEICIGLICVSKDFEPFFKVHRPKYVKNKTLKGFDGKEFTINNCFLFNCKLDFKTYHSSDEDKKRYYLATELIKTTKEIFIKKKIKDFYAEKLIEDLIVFFKKNNYL